MDNNPKPAWLITTYKQANKIKEHINRIRSEYSIFQDAPIIAVSTAVENILLNFKADNFHFIHFDDAPGNPKSKFVSKSYKPYFNAEKGIKHSLKVEWRDAYLAARIVLSIRLGFMKAEELGCNTVIHLHSDGYWLPEKVDYLRDIAQQLLDQEKIFYGDRSNSCEQNKLLPQYLHFHPEGTVFNLIEARKYNYGFNFDEIYNTPNSTDSYVDSNEFMTLHFGRTESLFSSWLLWCLTKQNIMKYDDPVDDLYYQKIIPGIAREPWGNHPHGLINFGQQLED